MAVTFALPRSPSHHRSRSLCCITHIIFGPVSWQSLWH